MSNPAKEYVDLVANQLKAPNFLAYQARGKEFLEGAEPLTADEQAYIDMLVEQCGGKKTFRIRECYFNSQRIISHDHNNRLQYWEGWACSEGLPIPVHHAWLTINGKVVDLTVQALKRKEAYKWGTWLYFGLEVPKKLIFKNCVDTGYSMPITESPVADQVFGV